MTYQHMLNLCRRCLRRSSLQSHGTACGGRLRAALTGPAGARAEPVLVAKHPAVHGSFVHLRRDSQITSMWMPCGQQG